jgi:hypothetical protein
VHARLGRNGPEVDRRINVSINDQFTWTYYLAQDLPIVGAPDQTRSGVVKAAVSAAFTQTTEFAMTAKSTYVLAQLPAAVLTPTTASVTA